MPLIQIVLSGPAAAPATLHALQQETTELMARILRKEAALTVVSVTQVPAGSHAVGGAALAASASLQALITAGSNSDAEKADFIFAAQAMLTATRAACPWAAAFAASPAPLYIALHELPATSWGYDGRTQAARKLEREAVLATGGAA